jgi:hypothetical protein
LLSLQQIDEETVPEAALVSGHTSPPFQGELDIAVQVFEVAAHVPTLSTPPKASGTTGIPSPSTSSAASPEYLLAGERFFSDLPRPSHLNPAARKRRQYRIGTSQWESGT